MFSRNISFLKHGGHRDVSKWDDNPVVAMLYMYIYIYSTNGIAWAYKAIRLAPHSLLD